MKKYFLYELRKSLPAIGYITLTVTVIYLLPLLTSSTFLGSLSVYTIYLSLLTGMAGLCAAVIPIWKFSYRMKKRSVDLFYSLPLSHKSILTVKFLIGLIALYSSYTVAYVLGALTAAIKFKSLISGGYYFAHYFASLIPLYIIYAVSAFAFTRANKRIDGVLFIIFWMSAVSVVTQVLDGLFGIYGDDYGIFTNLIDTDYYSVSAPLNVVTTQFLMLLTKTPAEAWLEAQLGNMIAGLTINGLLGIGATVGLFLLERKTKAENAEQVSGSWFGYKVMIPLYTVCYIAISTTEFVALNVIFVVLIALMSSAITILYKRTIKIGWKQLIVFGASVLGGIILGALCVL